MRITELSFNPKLMFRVSKQGHINFLTHFAAELNGGEPQKHLPDTYCFQNDFIVDANTFSDGELLLDGHTASALASFLTICQGLSGSWDSKTFNICL